MLMDVPARETGRWLRGERRAEFFDHDEKPEGLLHSQRTCWARSEAPTLLDESCLHVSTVPGRIYRHSSRRPLLRSRR